MTGSAGQKRIPSEYVKNSVFALPPLSEQYRIVTKAQQLMRIIDQLEEQLEDSQTQVQQLLLAVLKEAFEVKEKVYEENGGLTMAAEE